MQTAKWRLIGAIGLIAAVTIGFVAWVEPAVAETPWQRQLRRGTPEEKEAVLDTFQKEMPVAMVDSVIEALLDDTVSPRHGDTGWGRVYHQGATALGQFAEEYGDFPEKWRTGKEYSFYEVVGTADATRREFVHANWVKWWREHRGKIEAAIALKAGKSEPETRPEMRSSGPRRP